LIKIKNKHEERKTVTVLVLWIWIRMCLDLTDPNPALFVRIRMLSPSSIIKRKTVISTVLLLLYNFLSLKNDVNYLQKVKSKKLFFVC
jgi:hypothetical protein